jgi:hypothetical protein
LKFKNQLPHGDRLSTSLLPWVAPGLSVRGGGVHAPFATGIKTQFQQRRCPNTVLASPR